MTLSIKKSRTTLAIVALQLFASRHSSSNSSSSSSSSSVSAFVPVQLQLGRQFQTTTSTTKLGGLFDGGLFNFGGKEFATKAEIQHALQDAETSILDVRSKAEIHETGKIEATNNWYQYNCSTKTCPGLDEQAEDLFPNGKDAPIIIHCASGKRAMTAERTLKQEGYTNVLNAGTYTRMKEIMEDLSK